MGRLLCAGVGGSFRLRHDHSQHPAGRRGLEHTAGAAITIDNADKGKTPLIARLSRKDNHIVRVELPGYQPFSATLTRKASGWVWGNIVFGGLIGLAVDAISGGFYTLTPEQISATLSAANASVAKNGDGLYVFAVLQPQPGWTKIGQLQQR